MANVNKYLKTRFENQTDISTKKLISLLFTNQKIKWALTTKLLVKVDLIYI